MGNEIEVQGYHQITITEWLELKQEIGRELRNVAEGFVRLGYQLRRVRDEKLYEQDGYKSLSEFAETEYGLSPSLTSRFMAINERYSVDGNSKLLKPEYYGYGQTKLTEMLALPDSDLAMVTPDMQRQDIRDLKAFNKQAPQEGEADDRYQFFDAFFKDNREVVDALFGSGTSCAAVEQMKEVIIPGGNRTYRKGLFFASFTETDVKIKKFGSDPEAITWEEFRGMTEAIFAEDADGKRTYGNHYGIIEEEEAADGEGESAQAGEGEGSGADAADTHGEEPGQSDEAQEGTGDEPESDREPAEGATGGEGGIPAAVPGDAREGRGDPAGDAGEDGPNEAVGAAEDTPEDKEDDLGRGVEGDPSFAPAQMERQRLREYEYKISERMKKIRELVEQKAFATACVTALNLADDLKQANMVYGEILKERETND